MADPFEDEPAAGTGREKRRVKVYDLRNNDWFDRGTGFCAGRLVAVENGTEEGLLYVESEDHPSNYLLQTTIRREDGYQKQQATLIVWNEKTKDDNGLEMALSFQDADGCDAIWDFIAGVQQRQGGMEHDEVLSDDGMDIVTSNAISLPSSDIGNLEDIERSLRSFSLTAQGRDALAKFVIRENYIDKLASLVETAEDLESIHDLHMLCNIMKMLILLNDSAIIDHLVSEPVVFGVIGALEYDPEYPLHKANHRRYLMNQSRYKEVIKIADPAITSKIHATWRLTYLKDVVLARMLDDPTFGILNSLIFFNQVDIITYLQETPEYLTELFALIESPDIEVGRKKDAVGFIQSCCTIAKSLQLNARSTLYTTFLNHGLLRIINLAILQPEASLRVAGIEILVAVIDHNPNVVRAYILDSIKQDKPPLHHILIDLLRNETDLGVKVQVTDALKVLMDHNPLMQAQAQDIEQLAKARTLSEPQVDAYVLHFFEHSAVLLFQPLLDLTEDSALSKLSNNDVQLFIHLVEIMIFLTRSHLDRSRQYFFQQNLIQRITLLLSAPQKHLILIALKFVRACIGLRDDAYISHFLQKDTLRPILDEIYTTMPRDNLLNSACLELFEHIRHQGIKPLIHHLATVYKDKLETITYVSVFHDILHQWEILSHTVNTKSDSEGGNSSPTAKPNGIPNGTRWNGIREMDLAEQAYFDTSDDEDDAPPLRDVPQNKILKGNASPRESPRLVDYPDDEEDDEIMIGPQAAPSLQNTHARNGEEKPSPALSPSPVLRSLTIKRRRMPDDDEDDELGRLASNQSKRRSFSGDQPSLPDSSATSQEPNPRRKRLLTPDQDPDIPSNNHREPSKKIAISLDINKRQPPTSRPTDSPATDEDPEAKD